LQADYRLVSVATPSSSRTRSSRPGETDVVGLDVLNALATLGSVFLAHGRPRLSSRCAAPSLCYGPVGDCRDRPCGKPLRASRKAGPRSTGSKSGVGSRSAVADNRCSDTTAVYLVGHCWPPFPPSVSIASATHRYVTGLKRTPRAPVDDSLRQRQSRRGAGRTGRRRAASRRRRSAVGRPPSAGRGRARGRGCATTGTCHG